MTRALLPVLLFVSVAAFSQPRKNYSFLKHSHNRIIYSADSSAFVRFYKKLSRIEQGANEQLRIVHIGGSHVQAGLWSNAFVTAFQEKFIAPGGGYFVFPYKIARTNGQPYASSFADGKWKRCRSIGKEYCEPLGICALNVSTRDSAGHFGLMITDKAKCRYVNRLKVFHNFNPSFSFDICQGDSLKVKRQEYSSKGFTEFVFDMPVDSVCFRLTRHDTVRPEFTLFGFSMENDLAPGFYLAGLGANGASTRSYLKAALFPQQVAALNADLFILSLGVNDTQSKEYDREDYLENYDSLLLILRQASPDAAILLTTTTDNYIKRKSSNKRTISARDAMMQLMLTHQVGVWDLFSLMGGYKSMTAWYKAGLAARDKVHFNARGYALVGSLMYDALMRSYTPNRDNP